MIVLKVKMGIFTVMRAVRALAAMKSPETIHPSL